MADAEYRADPFPVKGDFRILKFDGMFHVVFRPDADPEWFRIIASFYTYDRAWTYCDVERVLSYDGDSGTSDEEKAALRTPPPISPEPGQASREVALATTVRSIYDGGEHVEPLLIDAHVEQPDDEEAPKDYYERLRDQAADEISKAADAVVLRPESAPPPHASADEEISPQQVAVLEVLERNANPQGLVSLSLAKISTQARVPHGSISFLLESLERKRLMRVVERGRAGQTTIYRVEKASPNLPRRPYDHDQRIPEGRDMSETIDLLSHGNDRAAVWTQMRADLARNTRIYATRNVGGHVHVTIGTGGGLTLILHPHAAKRLLLDIQAVLDGQEFAAQ